MVTVFCFVWAKANSHSPFFLIVKHHFLSVIKTPYFQSLNSSLNEQQQMKKKLNYSQSLYDVFIQTESFFFQDVLDLLLLNSSFSLEDLLQLVWEVVYLWLEVWLKSLGGWLARTLHSPENYSINTDRNRCRIKIHSTQTFTYLTPLKESRASVLEVSYHGPLLQFISCLLNPGHQVQFSWVRPITKDEP